MSYYKGSGYGGSRGGGYRGGGGSSSGYRGSTDSAWRGPRGGSSFSSSRPVGSSSSGSSRYYPSSPPSSYESRSRSSYVGGTSSGDRYSSRREESYSRYPEVSSYGSRDYGRGSPDPPRKRVRGESPSYMEQRIHPHSMAAIRSANLSADPGYSSDEESVFFKRKQHYDYSIKTNNIEQQTSRNNDTMFKKPLSTSTHNLPDLSRQCDNYSKYSSRVNSNPISSASIQNNILTKIPDNNLRYENAQCIFNSKETTDSLFTRRPDKNDIHNPIVSSYRDVLLRNKNNSNNNNNNNNQMLPSVINNKVANTFNEMESRNISNTVVNQPHDIVRERNANIGLNINLGVNMNPAVQSMELMKMNVPRDNLYSKSIQTPIGCNRENHINSNRIIMNDDIRNGALYFSQLLMNPRSQVNLQMLLDCLRTTPSVLSNTNVQTSAQNRIAEQNMTRRQLIKEKRPSKSRRDRIRKMIQGKYSLCRVNTTKGKSDDKKANNVQKLENNNVKVKQEPVEIIVIDD